MNAMLASSDTAQTTSASLVGNGPFASMEPAPANLAHKLVANPAELGRLPATVMVPPRESDMFAVIQVDGREVRLVVARLASDGTFHTVREERLSFAVAGGGPPEGGSAEGGTTQGGTIDGTTSGEEQRRMAIAMADILMRFQREAELLGAAIRAVATQSFRTLPNHQHLLNRLPRVTRVALEVISDREVARLVCLGALPGRLPGRRTLVIDVAEETTSLILADGEQPLALWRLPVGVGHITTGGSAISARLRAASWRRQVRQALTGGHLHAARGAAAEGMLIRSREVSSSAAVDTDAPGSAERLGKQAKLATLAFVEEIAAYLRLRKIKATDAGLHDGILRELSRDDGQGALTSGIAAG